MKCLKMILIVGFVGCVLKGPAVFAQETTDYLVELQDIRDPFAPQLPLPKVEPPQPVKPVPVVGVQPQPVGGNAIAAQPKPVAGNASLPIQPSPGIEVDSLVVKGVVWNSPTPQAIINDQVYKIGDKVKGMKIVSIGPKGIEISNNGVKVRINVPDKRK